MSISRLIQAATKSRAEVISDTWSDPDIANASYDSISLDVSANITKARGIFFKADGTKFYLLDNNGTAKDVSEYDLSTPWDITSATFNDDCGTVVSSRVGGDNIGDIFFKPDGTYFWVTAGAGFSSGNVWRFSLSTPWDITTASYSTFYSVSGQGTNPWGLHFKSDGTRMYVLANANDEINQYHLNSAWTGSTASYNSRLSLSGQDSNPATLFISPDGDKFWMGGFSTDNILEYSMSTAWNINTGTHNTSNVYDPSEIPNGPTGIYFRKDGAKMYLVTDQEIYQYST